MKTLEKCAFSTCLAGARGAGGYCEYHADRILSSNEEVNPETNRDKVLRGEAVQVSDGRLQEMQRIAVMREGVGLGDLHWHWAAVVNELIERRARLQNETCASKAWLIEWPATDNLPARWWHPKSGWMIDANKAVRFVRK